MDGLQERIGHRFASPNLLWQALTHPSNAGELSYQRLEFLGDSVLGLVIADMLFALYPKEAEGNLAKRHAGLVCGPTLAEIARGLDLGSALRLGQSEEQSGGRTNDSNLEDVCEAIIGAIYLDAGLEAARAFIQRQWSARAKSTITPPRDAKTRLQEWAQARSLPLPEYAVIEASGPAHAPKFVIEARLRKQEPARGEGTNKRQAEQAAASAMLAVVEKRK